MLAKSENEEVIPFKSGHILTQRVIVLFIILTIVNVIAIVADYSQVQLVERIVSGQAVTWNEAVANDDAQAIIRGIQIFLAIFIFMALLMWVYRVYRNLQSFSTNDLRFSPGWAVGGFFIPIWNLFHPFLVIREVWKASDPLIDTYDKVAWKKAPLSLLVTFWWLLFIISWFIGNIVNQWNIDTMSPEAIYTYSWSILAIDTLGIIYAIFTILILWKIDSRQKEKSKNIRFVFDPDILRKGT